MSILNMEQKTQPFSGFLEYTASAYMQASSTDLAPKNLGGPGASLKPHNYGEIGGISDTVLLMTYEWQSLAHWLKPLYSKAFRPKRPPCLGWLWPPRKKHGRTHSQKQLHRGPNKSRPCAFLSGKRLRLGFCHCIQVEFPKTTRFASIYRISCI